jgi:thiol-disulfide isomerase/thioredoxin
MRRLFILPIAAVLVCLPAWAFANVPAAHPHTIILFGADWCAPCVAELSKLPSLADVAAPDHLVLAWTDHLARLPDDAAHLGVTRIAPVKARALMVRFGKGNYGLPLVVMLRDDGTRCAMLRQSLSKEGIAALRRSCAGNGQAQEAALPKQTG